MTRLDKYSERFPNARLVRSETGVLEVTLRSNGGTLVFDGHTHEQFVDLFHHIGGDLDNCVVILTDRGNAFMESISPDGMDFFTPRDKIGSVRGRYFIPTRQELSAQTAKEWGTVNEIVLTDRLLARARAIAEGIAKLPRLTTRYTRIALTQKLRRIIDEGVGYGLPLEGISAAEVARAQ